ERAARDGLPPPLVRGTRHRAAGAPELMAPPSKTGTSRSRAPKRVPAAPPDEAPATPRKAATAKSRAETPATPREAAPAKPRDAAPPRREGAAAGPLAEPPARQRG